MTIGTSSRDTKENREYRKCFVEDEKESFLDSYTDAYLNAPTEFLKIFAMPLKTYIILLALGVSMTAGAIFVDRAIRSKNPKEKNIESVINQEYKNEKAKLDSAYNFMKNKVDSLYNAKKDSLKKVYENKLEKELK